MSTELQTQSPASETPQAHWWSGLTGRQWLVLIVAYFGWVFDVMDVYLMTIVKEPCMRDLLGQKATPENVATFSGLVLSLTLVGWSAGGLVFGMVADRWGRSRTMALTILIFSIFTGMAGFAQTWWQLFILRFIAAMGIGGEWGAGASMIAEVFPGRSRAVAAGILQSAAATGFFIATFMWRGVQLWMGDNAGGYAPWRWVFFLGALPAALALIVRLGIGEPEKWHAARQKAESAHAGVGSLSSVFSNSELRRRVLLGTLLATIGIFAYWGTTYWGPESLEEVLKRVGESGETLKTHKFWGMQWFHVGILTGFLIFIPITQWIGRKKAFFVFYLGSVISAPVAFLFSSTFNEWLVLFFLAGMFSSGIYSGYTIYFPELFPSRVRATGAGFCYNVGRVVAAPGPFLKGLLLGVFGSGAKAGAVLGCVYGLALVVIPFLPETKGVDIEAEPVEKS